MVTNQDFPSETSLPDIGAVPVEACNAPLRRDLPQRRSVRLSGYDYSQPGWYFVTIMAQRNVRLFGNIAPDATVSYSRIGAQVCQELSDFAARYPLLHLDTWVLMPNHIHFIVGLLPATAAAPARTIGQLVGAFKATTTSRTRSLRSLPGSLWQRSYHEHVIRNASELAVYREYVRNNPRRWLEKKQGLYLPDAH